MKPGLVNFLWALAGAALFGGLMYLVLHYQTGQTPAEQVELKARKVELAGQLRLALASAAEAEKSAVLAVTDEESLAFADQARAATATAEKQRSALGELLQAGGSAREKELLAQFSKSFTELQRVDQELLELAVRNTNLKASALAFGPAADAIREMDGALSRIQTASSARKVMLAAAGAQAAALRLEVLLPPHIAEESDQKMDALEARMAKEDAEVANDLKALAALLPAANADVQTATASYARFTGLKTQILKLSRENTNVRSLSISLNQKRKLTVLCQDALAALEKTIAEEQIAGADHHARPR